MQFIDHTGHVFSLPHYRSYPTGYEYNENPYVFWINDEYASNLSVDCIYIQPIRPVIHNTEISSVKIICDSKHYKLISSKQIQNKIIEGKDIFNVELDYYTEEAEEYLENVNNDFKTELSGSINDEENSDIIFIENLYKKQWFWEDKNHKKYQFTDIYNVPEEDALGNRYIHEITIFTDSNDRIISKNYSGIKSEWVIYELAKYEYKSQIDLNELESAERHFIYTDDFGYYCLDHNKNKKYISNEIYANLDSDRKGNKYVRELEIFIDYNGKRMRKPFNSLSFIYETMSEEDKIKYNITEADKLTATKYILSSNDINYTMIPFYVASCGVREPGAWLTNVLIQVNSKSGETYYCPITVGGTYTDEEEALIINGKNIGVNLPKDICKALYKASFNTDFADLSLWNQKIKEYLLHHIKLRAERGNYDSALTALKWFGWGDKIELSALVQTDNEVINQYILDKFDLNYDVINEFRYFRNSTLLNLYLRGVTEDKDSINEYNFENDFWGESKPNTINLFDKIVETSYDEKDITFYKPYYDWTFNEIALKLSALKYFYQKYFLPIHLNVYNSTITYQTFANDIKILNSARTLITERYLYNTDNIQVEFPKGYNNTIWLAESNHFIDVIDSSKPFSMDNSNWIEFTYDIAHNYPDEYSDYYVFEINDNCFSIPIKFISEIENKYYNCILYTYKDGELFKLSKFSFIGKSKESVINFVLYPKLSNTDFTINFWLDAKFEFKLWVNNKWFEYKFVLGVPELDIEMHKLQYKYDHNVCKQFIKFEENKPIFNANIYVPELVSISNINFINDYIDYMKNNYCYTVDEDNNIFKNNVYYYYYLPNGDKVILSSGKFTLWFNPHIGKYQLVRREYINYLLSLTKEEVDEIFPDIVNYIIYDGNEYDETDTEHKHIVSEMLNHLVLDIDYMMPTKNKNIVDIPSGVTLYSSVYKNIYSFIDLYNEDLNIPKNDKYFNKIHLFELVRKTENNYFENIPYNAEESTKENFTTLTIDVYEKNGIAEYNNLKFGDNDSEFIKELYSTFFNVENGEWDKPIFIKDDKGNWINSTIEPYLYDLYLMHDNDIWYVIMISKDTISENLYEIENTTYKITDNIFLKYVRSDEKFLINRMELVDMHNKYHFNDNDMIVAKLNNYKDIPFKLTAGSKWTFTPLGLGSDVNDIQTSNTNFALLSINESMIKHKYGYVGVRVAYSIDNFLNNVQERETRILISESTESKEINNNSYKIKKEPIIKRNPEISVDEIIVKNTPVIGYKLFNNATVDNRYISADIPDIYEISELDADLNYHLTIDLTKDTTYNGTRAIQFYLSGIRNDEYYDILYNIIGSDYIFNLSGIYSNDKNSLYDNFSFVLYNKMEDLQTAPNLLYVIDNATHLTYKLAFKIAENDLFWESPKIYVEIKVKKIN